jgi:hypothetical protein
MIKPLKNIHFLENLHIPLWLLKDISWLMIWKPLGMFMIVPTVTVAVMLVIATRKILHRLLMNLATLCWILANSNWMSGEFYSYNFRPISFTFFLIGIFFTIMYFLYYVKRKVNR